MRNKLGIFLLVAILFAVVPFPVHATSWEDYLDEAHQAGYEVGYEEGYGNGYIAGESDAKKQLEEYSEYARSPEIISENAKPETSQNQSTRIEDITELIRQAQAEAIGNVGGITASGKQIDSETRRILSEKYGIGSDVVSYECPVDHELISDASRNKGRIESAAVCAALFTLYAFLLRRK